MCARARVCVFHNMARLLALAACLGVASGQTTVAISVSGGDYAAPYYLFSPALPDMLEAGTNYVFTAAGIDTSHPFRVGTARGITPVWVTGTTTGFTGTGSSLTVAAPSNYAGSEVVLYCNNHPIMTLTRLVATIPTGAPCTGNTLDQHWIQAPLSTSCTDACTAVGRSCVDNTDHVTTETCINEISNLPTINRPCVTYQSSSVSNTTPTIYDGGGSNSDTCYYHTGSNAHVDCTYQFTTTWFNRICPCLPDSPPPLLPPPPPPPIAPLACPVSEAACTDHGADEAAATAECASNPLCYVLGTPTGAAPYTACTDFVQVGKWEFSTVTRWPFPAPHPTASTCAEAGFTRIDNPSDCQLASDAIGFVPTINNLVGDVNAGDYSNGCTVFSQFTSYVGNDTQRQLVFVDTGTEDCTKDTNGITTPRSAACVCCQTYGTITPSTYQACTCPSPPPTSPPPSVPPTSPPPSVPPSPPPPPPLLPLHNAHCIHGESPLFTNMVDADAQSPVGTSTATTWNLGNGDSYWKPDAYPGATAAGGSACLEGTATELIPVHVVPKHKCDGDTLTGAARYPYATHTEAQAACVDQGCSGGLAPASALNSAWYAWRGVHAADDKSTAEIELCYAAWYVNDINFQVEGVAESHEQLYFMHSANPPVGCGNQGMNHWLDNPINSAAACLGCPYYLERCPSPPPASPPPPTSPPPSVPPVAVEEPSSVLMTIGIVGGGLFGALAMALVLLFVCAAPIAAAAGKIDCDNPPAPNTVAHAQWLRECERRSHRDSVPLMRP